MSGAAAKTRVRRSRRGAQRTADIVNGLKRFSVVDREERLLGVLSLKDLILAQPKAQLASFVVTNPKRLVATANKKEAAEMVSRYNLFAIPVVDETDHLLGIITVDDVVDMLLPTPLRRKR